MLGFRMLGPHRTETSRGQAVHFKRAQEADMSRSSRVRGVHVDCTRVRACACVVGEGAIYRQTGREKKGGKKWKSDWLSSLQEAFIEQPVRSL